VLRWPVKHVGVHLVDLQVFERAREGLVHLSLGVGVRVVRNRWSWPPSDVNLVCRNSSSRRTRPEAIAFAIAAPAPASK
jgi:hypothetical protein